MDFCSTTAKKQRKLNLPSAEEKKLLLDSLASMSDETTAKPGVLSVMAGYCDKYIPCALGLDFPTLLTDLFKPSYLSLSYFELSSKMATFSITDQQRKLIEAILQLLVVSSKSRTNNSIEIQICLSYKSSMPIHKFNNGYMSSGDSSFQDCGNRMGM